MGERITVVGGSDSAIAVTLDGSQAIRLATQFSKELGNYYLNDNLNFLDVTDSPDLNDKIGYGVITQGGAYSAGNGYKYITVGGQNVFDPSKAMTPVELSNANLLKSEVTINSKMDAGQSVNILAGNILAGSLKGFTYNANLESGVLAAGSVDNNISFNGNTVAGAGNWSINTGKGNDTIITGSGNNSVYASTGENSIDITSGRLNRVNSQGKDTIIASQSSLAQNSVTLRGGVSEAYHAEVSLNAGASVTDISLYNTVTVGGGSTITGSTYGSYNFDGSYNDLSNTMNNGVSSTINATGDLLVVHGDSNTITASKSLTVLNATNNTESSAQGQAVVFGSEGVNYTLNAAGNDAGLFVANVGNETLNASGSTVGLSIYANTVVGGNANLIATGGSGNDVLTAGVGNSTFSGGAGDNLFIFTKEVAQDGNTVITDFARNDANNKIDLFNYGLDNDSLTTLLKNSKNDAKGNAVLNLDGHTITVEGVSISDLNINKFDVANASIKSS